MLCLGGLSLCVLLISTASAHVFLSEGEASQMLTRRRRANSYFEELKQGNLERECMEERCNLEEAREIYEDQEKTNEFWAKYIDGDACESMPCAHGGRCEDGIGSYSCYCAEGYQGSNCEIAAPQLCENQNGGCEHFCRVVRGHIECSCADGYFPVDKSCHSNEPFKCGAIISGKTRSIFRYQHRNYTQGSDSWLNQTDIESNITSTAVSSPGNFSTDQIPHDFEEEEYVLPEMVGMTRIVNGKDCPPGECPWQALLINEEGQGFCGGTILTQYIILTAAHCMKQLNYISVRLGEFDVLVTDGNEANHNVEAGFKHHNYRPDTYHNDIALIKLATPIKFSRFVLPACMPESDFAEKVLMKQPLGMVSGFGRLGEGQQPSTILQRLAVPYVARQVCQESTGFHISTRMFCAGYDKEAKDSCKGDSGGPHVTKFKGTYFLTGIVSWGEGCAREGKYGVYTQVSRYIRWIREGIQKLMSVGRVKRHQGPIRWLDM
ncbi:coagulation factor X-like [Entelurus aequoreus]|uniref:coagulation factor X-like n=1 Tax=Entelurus aequoreus TaxID=161455 RepID=UPI002B1D1FD8|nr:coagulation factor X-like [Entelurus aequoreus]